MYRSFPPVVMHRPESLEPETRTVALYNPVPVVSGLPALAR